MGQLAREAKPTSDDDAPIHGELLTIAAVTRLLVHHKIAHHSVGAYKVRQSPYFPKPMYYNQSPRWTREAIMAYIREGEPAPVKAARRVAGRRAVA